MHKLISLRKYLSSGKHLPFYTLATYLGVLAAMGLSAVIITIYFGRPIGDDFGSINFYHDSQWFNRAVESLQSTGRYSQSIISSLVYGIFGAATATVLPLITIIWAFGLLYIFIRRLSSQTFSPLLRAGLTGLVLFLLLFVNTGVDGTPPQTWITFQTFFWSSGIVTYTLALLILITSIYILFIRPNSITKKTLIIYGFVVYAASLFNEVQPATLFSLSSVLLFVTFLRIKSPLFERLKSARGVFLVSMVGSLLALLTLFLSAGNKARRASTGALNLDGLIESVLHKTRYVLDHLFFRPRDIILFLAVGFIIAYGLYIFKKKVTPRFTATLVITGGITLAACVLSILIAVTLLVLGYGVGTGILPRTFLIPQVLYTLGFLLLFTGIWIRFTQTTQKRFVTRTLAFIAILFVILMGIFTTRYLDKITTQINTTIDYGQAWDYQDNLLKEKARLTPNETIYIPGDNAGIGDGFSVRCTGPYVQNTSWLNEAIADYYRVKQVCSLEDKSR